MGDNHHCDNQPKPIRALARPQRRVARRPATNDDNDGNDTCHVRRKSASTTDMAGDDCSPAANTSHSFQVAQARKCHNPAARDPSPHLPHAPPRRRHTSDDGVRQPAYYSIFLELATILNHLVPGHDRVIHFRLTFLPPLPPRTHHRSLR